MSTSDKVKGSIREILSIAGNRPVGRFHFRILGDGDGQSYWVSTAGDQNEYFDGERDADVSIRFDSAEFLDACDGGGLLGFVLEQEFLAGRIRVDGDCLLALDFFECAQVWQFGGEAGDATPNEGNAERIPGVKHPCEDVAVRNPVDEIERVQSATKEEFLSQYLERGRPVIITELAQDWPIIQLERLRLIDAFRPFYAYVRRGDYVSTAFSATRNFSAIALNEYLDNEFEAAPSDGEYPAYVGNNLLPEPLYDSIRFPYFKRFQFAPPRMWLGPAKTVTPLHRDPNDNFIVQCLGSKRFILASPDQRPNLYTWSRGGAMRGLEGCDVDPANIDVEKYPLARDAKFLTVDLHQGETLFLPEGWFHYVEALTPSVMISMWLANSKRR